MCTLVLLRRPGHSWPLMLAANRDEMTDRPWSPPGRHWPDRPELLAGRDDLAGGSWLGLNDHGVAAAILNRMGSLGPQDGKRSRGELVLEALDHAEAVEAARALAELNPEAYRSFNLVVADPEQAFWLRHGGGTAPIEMIALPPGLSMLTAYDLNDRKSPRIRTNLPRFEAAPPPDPERDDWASWQGILASRLHDTEAGPLGAMTVLTDRGFATVSSSIIALPAPGGGDPEDPKTPIWMFAAGRPDIEQFQRITT